MDFSFPLWLFMAMGICIKREKIFEYKFLILYRPSGEAPSLITTAPFKQEGGNLFTSRMPFRALRVDTVTVLMRGSVGSIKLPFHMVPSMRCHESC